MVPNFDAKKAAPAFRVKKAAAPSSSSSTASPSTAAAPFLSAPEAASSSGPSSATSIAPTGDCNLISSTLSAQTSDSGDVSPAVAKYFTFMFSRWTSVRQEYPDSSPREVQEKLWQQWNSSRSAPPAIPAPSSSKQSKRTGSVKDPLEPKKPPTVFLLFLHSIKDEVMESMPEMSYKEVMAEMGRAWNGLTDEEKSPFLLQHKQLMDQWYKDRDAYRKQKDESLGRKRKVKDPLQPKKPPSVFFLFFHSAKNEVMASNPEMTYKEVKAVLGSLWNELGAEKKAPFKANHQQMMNRWRKACEKGRVRIPNKVEKMVRKDVEVEENEEDKNEEEENSEEENSEEENSEEENSEEEHDEEEHDEEENGDENKEEENEEE